MAKFIAISGPSATGKTTLSNVLSTYPEFENAVFLPDMFESVWQDIVNRGLFSEFDDINKDTEFLCVFILNMLDYYNGLIELYEEDDALVVFDCCWLDLGIYSILNMWYTHMVREVQESILSKLSKFDDRISRIYITQFDESKQMQEKYRIPFKRSNIKHNRKLELEYYGLAKHMKNAEGLPSSDTTESALFILEDLKKLGYL